MNFFVRLLLPVFTLISCSVTIHAQTVRVLNAVSRKAIENVALYNHNKQLSALTNRNGEADISRFSSTDTIHFQHPSYAEVALTKTTIVKEGLTVLLSEKNILLDEFVIAATKTPEKRMNLPQMADVLDATSIKRALAPTSADLLESTGNIMVQKSQSGGGSPVLRGFEANKVLLVVDGVRMNNAIYRNGHLQNSITIDNAILDRVEVIYGPGSLIYGSDALGGVISYHTKDPELASAEGEQLFRVNSLLQYASAIGEQLYHADFNSGSDRLASLTSITYKKFGDIRMGKTRSPFIGDFGRDFYYAERINGRDTMLTNPNPDIQRETGYSQLDILQKILYQPSEHLRLLTNVQLSTSSDINRYDQLNDYSGGNLKYAEWYYGPQKRLLISERADYDAHTALFDNMTTLLAIQKVEEDRISRRFGDTEKYSQMEKADVFTGNLDFLKNISPSSRIIYGLAFAYNRVNSTARYTNIDTGAETPAQTRYPDGGSYTLDYAAYLGYRLKAGTKYTIAGGLRYSRNMLHSDFTSDFIQLPFNAVDIRNGAVTGSLSTVFHPDESFKISLIASTGFRNPNVDDYGKVRAKDGFVTVPSGGLGPEYTYNLEAGITKVFNGEVRFSGAVYITWLDQAIVRADYTYQGKDSLEYDGEMYRMITNVNADKAMIRGFSANLSGKLNRHLEMRSTLNVQEGKDLSNDVPLPHIPPVFGRTELRWQQKRFGAGAWVEYYGWKRLKDMSPYGEDNEEEATQYGYPAWYTLNLQAHYDFGKNVTVQAGLENLTDNYYKVFSSGVSAPGRSFNLSLRATF